MALIKVGVEVIAELNRNGQPRWQYKNIVGGRYQLADTGYSGEMINGLVVSIKDNVASIQFVKPDNSVFEFQIALEGHQAFDPEQWNFPGFPIPVRKVGPKVVCTCGSDSIYGINNGAHSHWCDLRRASQHDLSR